mmetsp:Transcript_191/g.275  ORF Transcript_191/g.275 Transcript_191/m.275 type:complete len:153 (-) Transcript_191:43-501(-)
MIRMQRIQAYREYIGERLRNRLHNRLRNRCNTVRLDDDFDFRFLVTVRNDGIADETVVSEGETEDRRDTHDDPNMPPLIHNYLVDSGEDSVDHTDDDDDTPSSQMLFLGLDDHVHTVLRNMLNRSNSDSSLSGSFHDGLTVNMYEDSDDYSL